RPTTRCPATCGSTTTNAASSTPAIRTRTSKAAAAACAPRTSSAYGPPPIRSEARSPSSFRRCKTTPGATPTWSACISASASRTARRAAKCATRAPSDAPDSPRPARAAEPWYRRCHEVREVAALVDRALRRIDRGCSWRAPADVRLPLRLLERAAVLRPVRCVDVRAARRGRSAEAPGSRGRARVRADGRAPDARVRGGSRRADRGLHGGPRLARPGGQLRLLPAAKGEEIRRETAGGEEASGQAASESRLISAPRCAAAHQG